MLDYIKQGWNGQLTFTEILFGYHLELLESVVIVIAYVGFYILSLMAFKAGSFQDLWIYVFFIYGIGCYVWLLRAFWGSANYAKTPTRAYLIRIFTLLLPVISIVSFVFILIYWIVRALLDNFC